MELIIDIPDDELEEFTEFMCEEHYPSMVPDPNSPADMIQNDYSKIDFMIDQLNKNIFKGFTTYQKKKLLGRTPFTTQIKVRK